MKDTPIDGLLLLDKPSGPTSHDLVARVRRDAGIRRVGHGGTLDPLASGLLPIVLGRATRLVRFLPHSPKVYTGSLQLEVTTDTDDLQGSVSSTFEGPLPDPARVIEEASALEGRQLQVPPAFSARKVGGKRLYSLARKGIHVDAPPAEIDVTRFELEATDVEGVFRFVAEVSAGTYIRGLARDLGHRLGCGGTLASLRRVRIGPMDLTRAVRPPEPSDDRRGWTAEHVIPLEQIPMSPPALTLADPALAQRFRLGAAVRWEDEKSTGEADFFRVLSPTGCLLGMAERRGGLLHPKVVLRSAE